MWGYTGEFGSRGMNIWLIKQVKQRIRDEGGFRSSRRVLKLRLRVERSPGDMFEALSDVLHKKLEITLNLSRQGRSAACG